jgi:NADPH-dependent 2,4-dienoyl-CoA reductase/sulfur reductase-like enzyme
MRKADTRRAIRIAPPALLSASFLFRRRKNRGINMRGLTDKVAIVPGGATKIGVAVVEAFKARGVKVVVADIDSENGAKLACDTVHFQRTDLRSDNDIKA